MADALHFAGVQLQSSASSLGGRFRGEVAGFKIRVWSTSLGWRASCLLGGCSVSATGANASPKEALSELRLELRRTARSILALLALKGVRRG